MRWRAAESAVHDGEVIGMGTFGTLGVGSTTGWINKILAAENVAHRAFFGQTFDLSPFRSTLERYGENRVNQWAELGLEPHYLPKCTFSPDAKVRGWKVRLELWYWEQLAAGNIKRRNGAGELETVTAVGFDGATLLIDTRCKPVYDNGRQMFLNDEEYLGVTIETLREQGKIARYDHGPQSSRFGVSSLEWDKQVRPALEARPEFGGVTFRLELGIEGNVIPQMYKRMPRCGDGQTNTWVWYEEYFEGVSYRLDGGYSGRGGLASVCCNYVDGHWYYGALRPVGVLDARTV